MAIQICGLNHDNTEQTNLLAKRKKVNFVTIQKFRNFQMNHEWFRSSTRHKSSSKSRSPLRRTQQDFSDSLSYVSPVPTSATDQICHFCDQQQAKQKQLQIFLFFFRHSLYIYQLNCTNEEMNYYYCVIIKVTLAASSITTVWILESELLFWSMAPLLFR